MLVCFADESTRVKLPVDGEDELCGYINANYVRVSGACSIHISSYIEVTTCNIIALLSCQRHKIRQIFVIIFVHFGCLTYAINLFEIVIQLLV